jgi:hypothetical protein
MPCKEKISERKLLEDLIRVSRKLEKKHISKREYNIHGKYSDSMVKRRLGSWNRAVIIAGLKVYEGKNIPEKLLIINLESVWRKLGRMPVKRDMVKPLSAFCESAYSNFYGSWQKTLTAFSGFLNNRGKYLMKMDKETRALRDNLAAIPTGKKKRTGRTISYRLRYMVLKRDRHMCRSCGSSPADDKRVTLEIDHIIPWSKGGDSSINNLQTLCRKCNLGKGNLTH